MRLQLLLNHNFLLFLIDFLLSLKLLFLFDSLLTHTHLALEAIELPFYIPIEFSVLEHMFYLFFF